ncbi:hypothetical protein REPUB_Repub09cG0172600 [Reevesia pubescens]
MASYHGRGNGYSPEPHHFFKVILEDTIQDGKCSIPRKFARDYGNALSSPLLFKVPNGEVWEVELTKSDGKMWLQNGWQKFSEHYSLELGHFLVFRHEGNSRFHVLIFNRTASEIDYPYANDNEEIQQQKVKIEEPEEDDSVQIIREKPELQCPWPHKIMRANPGDETMRNLKFEYLAAGFKHNNGVSARKDKVRSTTVFQVRRLNYVEKSKALERASSDFKSENPFFFVVMQSAYVTPCSKRSCCLAIPKEFSRKYLMHHGDVILCDSNGKTWSAEYRSIRSNRRPYVRLSNGWGTFARDNKLQVGDVCAFELIDCIEISFKVFIYRGKKADFHGSQAFSDVSSPANREAGTSSTHQGCLEPLKAPETALQRAVKARQRALQRAQAFTSENPFFVVVLQRSYVRTHALCIPHHFARKHFNSTLTNIDVVLYLSNGKSWPAEYHQRSIGRPYGKICNGWRAFVKDNKLKVGDVCVLEMTNDNKISFKVFIFKVIADANCHQSQGGISSSTTGGKGRFSTQRSTKSEHPSSTLPLTSHEKAIAIQRARDFKSENPFFKVVMQPAYLKYGCSVNIPYKFVKTYLDEKEDQVILQVSDGRNWIVKFSVNVVTSGQHKAKFSHTWKDFARDNNLEVGDVCVFELINRNETSFKVSIFSAAPDAKFSPLPQADDTRASQVASENYLIPKLEADDDFGNCLGNSSRATEQKVKLKALAPNLRPDDSKFREIKLENPNENYKLHRLMQGVMEAIPLGFSRNYFTKSVGDVILCTPDGKTWWTEYSREANETNPRARLTDGWRTFAEDNNLEVGDVCAFEMIKSKDYEFSFNVVIYHAEEDERWLC